jgi:hypothetical protein
MAVVVVVALDAECRVFIVMLSVVMLSVMATTRYRYSCSSNGSTILSITKNVTLSITTMTLSITILDAECHVFIVMLISVLPSLLAADGQLTCRSVHKMIY